MRLSRWCISVKPTFVLFGTQFLRTAQIWVSSITLEPRPRNSTRDRAPSVQPIFVKPSIPITCCREIISSGAKSASFSAQRPTIRPGQALEAYCRSRSGTIVADRAQGARSASHWAAICPNRAIGTCACSFEAREEASSASEARAGAWDVQKSKASQASQRKDKHVEDR